MMVGGLLPLGCTPLYLTAAGTPNVRDYEPDTGCLKWLNKLSKYHDHLLQKELHHARKTHSHATIAFADYYSILKRVFRSPNEYGFDGREALVACCGAGGGRYNYNLLDTFAVNLRTPGNGLRVCPDPSSHVSWDGLHLTEKAYGLIARALPEGPYSVPPLS